MAASGAVSDADLAKASDGDSGRGSCGGGASTSAARCSNLYRSLGKWRLPPARPLPVRQAPGAGVSVGATVGVRVAVTVGIGVGACTSRVISTTRVTSISRTKGVAVGRREDRGPHRHGDQARVGRRGLIEPPEVRAQEHQHAQQQERHEPAQAPTHGAVHSLCSPMPSGSAACNHARTSVLLHPHFCHQPSTIHNQPQKSESSKTNAHFQHSKIENWPLTNPKLCYRIRNIVRKSD